jgi:hypothetical protein
VANSVQPRPLGLFSAALVMTAGLALAPARVDAPWTASAQQRGGIQQPAPKAQSADTQEQVLADFMERVKQFVALHQKVEATLPHMPKEATPKQIDERERALSALIQNARAGAKRGDIFTSGMSAFVKRVLARIFGGAEGKQLRASIMDENVKPITLKVNQRYPDEIPIATMPPEVLQALPKLPEELEYRFLSEQLILLDRHAHIIVDFIVDALPGK